jgi:cation-transporting ATPase F
LVAALVTALLHELVDAAVILGVVVLNATIGFLQEAKASAALDALRAMTRTDARVVRDGRPVDIAAEDLVRGDVVLLEAGNKIPADLRLISAVELAVDESALTGESVPVLKSPGLVPAAAAVADRWNSLHAGTLVASGSATGVVIATGERTELGSIHRLVSTTEALATPLTRKLNDLSRFLTLSIVVLALIAFAVGAARGRPLAETFTAAVALAVGAIPEGLPAAVTITLAIGVTRMARRRAIVRRLPAVETLGSTTVICSDKTGTLTQNQMTVCALWTPGARYTVSGSGYGLTGDVRDPTGALAVPDLDQALRWSLVAGGLCNDAVVGEGGEEVLGDPTEAAMLVVAAKAGLHPTKTAPHLPRMTTTPFSSERGFMATVHQDRGGATQVVLVKGAVERVLDMCVQQMRGDGSLEALDHHAATRAAEELAARGLRVLATATRFVSGTGAVDEDRLHQRLTFTGLQAMMDPPRPAAAASVAACRAAGIAVKMITGDHAVTATAIGRMLGLLGHDLSDGQVLVGHEIATLSPEELPAAVERASVFARVSPEQKLQLVQALQRRHHVVCMTGDGVNDAPALRRADIGVAMGASGTEVAKEASDMVLIDDDFATIEAAVEEGRGVFDNLTKFILWTLPTNVGEGAVLLVALLVGGALPILPTQILWINMTTAVALGLMLAFEPREPGTMTRPPRAPDRPLLTRALMLRVGLVSMLLVLASWSLFQYELGAGATLAQARTAAVNAFVAIAIFYLFSCRSLVRAPWRIGWLSNRWVLAGVTAQVLGQVLFTYMPAMNALFHTAPIGAGTWLRILLLASLAAVVVAIDKRARSHSF